MRRRVLAKPLAVVAAPADTTAPTVPTNVTASSITSSGFTVSWTASTDAVGVTGYDVQINGTSYATPTTTSVPVTGRAASTAYAVRVRARDAAGNFSALSTAVNVTTSAAALASLFSTQTPATADTTDNLGVTLATRFTTDADGSVTGVRFYRATTAPTTVIGLLYSDTGTELARATFGTLTTGWNSVTFATPINVTAGTYYRAAYWTSGPYVATSGFFASSVVNAHLTGTGGLFGYATSPTGTMQASTAAFFADVLFAAGVIAPSTAPATPSAPSVAAGDGSLFVSWVAPADGGSTITGYDVQPFAGATGGTVVSVGNVLSTTLTGLTNGTAYTVKVRAKNAVGNSAYSAASAAATPVASSTSITHGDQLTINHVGPWTLQGVAKGSEVLTALDPGNERVSTYPGNARPSWVPGTAYAYNNLASNHGGIVPAGGLVIDGFFVPAGTWVVQFRNFNGTSNVIIEGDCGGAGSSFPGIMFRGCRMRGPWIAPGFINNNAQSTGGTTWVNYCDAGGVSMAAADYCEIPFTSQRTLVGGVCRDHQYLIRNYITNATTLAFAHNDGDGFIENWGEHILDFTDSTKHLNGFANGGGEAATLWLRNHVTTIQEAGSTMANDIFQMAADGGGYPGTASNLDGSVGYIIKDNYVGGANFVLQLGVDKANASADVSNVKVTGNKFTTSVYPNSGSTGVSYKNPAWNSQGNVWSGNTWADGANAGQTISAPA